MSRRPLSLAICLLVPFVILLLGLGFAGWKAVKASTELGREDGRGVVPPGFTVEVSEAGKHTVWLHTSTIFEGQAYESGSRLPAGAKLLLTDESTGDAIDLTTYMSASKSFGNDRAVSLGTFQLLSPTRISVMGTGIQNPVIISIAPEKMPEVFKTVIQVGGIAALSIFLAILTLIVLLHRRQKAIQAEERMHVDVGR